MKLDVAERIEPAVLLAKLLDELDRFGSAEHLAALDALDRHDVELLLVEPGTVTVVVGPCVVSIPLGELIVETSDQ